MGQLPIHPATLSRHLEVVRFMLECDPSLAIPKTWVSWQFVFCDWLIVMVMSRVWSLSLSLSFSLFLSLSVSFSVFLSRSLSFSLFLSLSLSFYLFLCLSLSLSPLFSTSYYFSTSSYLFVSLVTLSPSHTQTNFLSCLLSSFFLSFFFLSTSGPSSHLHRCREQ